MGLFGVGEIYPPYTHLDRIKKYRTNRELFKGNHFEAIKDPQNRIGGDRKELLYLSVNLPGVICKKSADLLFGEKPTYSAGKADDAKEQTALEKLVDDNDLNHLNYKSALGNAYRGDSFYKIRWGQEWEGMVDKKADPFRSIIESQNPEYVFPETMPGNASKIYVYHIAYPEAIAVEGGEAWVLNVESHYPGYIQYSKYEMESNLISRKNVVEQWRITAPLPVDVERVETGVPFPLVVHVANYATDESWEGIDDLSEHMALFDEINTRLTQIANILDKHADPAIAVPTGTLGEDEYGNPMFNIGRDKVFEIMGKDDIVPQYLTWNGQLNSAFQELEKLVDLLLICAEIPEVALGAGDTGTSGSSGLAIKFRLSSLLAKINRKRQFYDKGLQWTIFLAQTLEESRTNKLGFKPFTPNIKFQDGLPKDDLEQANIMSLRTGGKPTLSQKSALMEMDGLTEEQADAEIDRMAEEAKANQGADPSVFNADTSTDNPDDLAAQMDTNKKDLLDGEDAKGEEAAVAKDSTKEANKQ